MSTATETKCRPILFSGPMVRAILRGDKTQTRRVIKPQPIQVERHERFHVRCPFGLPGDNLWVRETFARTTDNESRGAIAFKADNECQVYLCDYGGEGDPVGLGEATSCDEWDHEPTWKPSIHMPRWASRITLEVVEVRVERLQEMSEYDLAREGYHERSHAKCLKAFVHSWDALNAKRGFSWESNPWVWVVEFNQTEASHEPA